MNFVQIVSSILQATNNKLVSKAFQEKYRIGNSFSRSRKLSFSTLIYFILQSVPKSIPINYSQFLDSFSSPLPFVSKQAISKVRHKISDGAFQEFFTAMYFSNLAAILKRDADTQILTLGQKHRYQANRSYLLNRIKAKIIPLLQASISSCKRMIIQLTEKASKVRFILRPNRTFGRYRKHTRRKYYNHMKPCM